MNKTKIDWADRAWNPVTGCTKISEGCQNCYAERMSKRLQLMSPKKYSQGFSVKCHPEALQEPLKIKKPQRIFVCSMGDLFHDDVPFEFIDSVFAVMALCPQHTFIVLTKRPQRMAEYYKRLGKHAPKDPASLASAEFAPKGSFFWKLTDTGWVLPNVWLGVTAENQARADERIPILLQIPAAVRLVSIEPMLSEIDLRYSCFNGADGFGSLPGLDWIICGGETGPGARPIHPDWVRSLRDQCAAANVPFFFKQWGEWAPSNAKPVRGQHTGGGIYLHLNGKWGCQGDWWDGKATAMDKIGKRAAGHMLDGKEHRAFPKKGEV